MDAIRYHVVGSDMAFTIGTQITENVEIDYVAAILKN